MSADDKAFAALREALGDRVALELRRAYATPPRHYHSFAHAATVAGHVADLGGGRAAVVAAWFHDAVYVPGSHGNEESSAALLLRLLGDDPDADEAARLVRITTAHVAAPDDRDAAVLCDADLAILGADAAQYEAYRAAVRAEFASVPDEQWRAGRAAVLRALLARDPLYRTEEGQRRWEAGARRNLAAELADLDT